MERTSNRPSQFERAYRILEYLRWNSDREHPVVQADMKQCDALRGYMGGNDTSHNLIINMVSAMNFDEHGLRPRSEWKLVFKEFEERYAGDPEEDGKGEETLDKLRIRGLHYQHRFTYDEVNRLIEAVQFSSTMSTGETRALVDKLERCLTTKFYPQGPKQVCTVLTSRLTPPEKLRENLLVIQRAIDAGVKIAFRFNGYNRHRELVPVRTEKETVSPYYIVAYAGRYYLLACAEGYESMSVWRVDLMTELELPERDRRALEKRKVENLPQTWDDTFLFSHLNMSYDKPIPITLRIVNPRQGEDGKPWTNCTFLYDYFGDTIRCVHTETEPPYGDIVRVMCSPFGMVNWALQYADLVEVLEPTSVREAVKEKLERLNRKYGGGEEKYQEKFSSLDR